MTSPLPDDAEIFVPVRDLREMFDIICGSLDFGSGFLDTEQVLTMRRVAVLLGVDPMSATPDSHASFYPHPFAAAGYFSAIRADNPFCKCCYKGESWACHTPEGVSGETVPADT